MNTMIINIAQSFADNNFQFWEVGGSVRDHLMGNIPNDYDFATDAYPNEIAALLSSYGSVYNIGSDYGTVGCILADTTKIEVTTFRDEVYATDSRKPTVIFGKSLLKDLARRDFTINSIARNLLTGEIIDPFNGIQDIKNKIIRCVGNNNRFDEDPLRMLRAIRFMCRFSFAIYITIKHPERLNIVSKERIQVELSNILLGPNPHIGIKTLCDFGLMSYICPEFINLRGIAGGKHHIKDPFEHSLMVLEKGSKIKHNKYQLEFLLSCWLHDLGKATTISTATDGEVHFYRHQFESGKFVTDIMQRLRYKNDSIRLVYTLVLNHMAPIMLEIDGTSKRSVTRLIRKVGEDNIRLLLHLVLCDITSSNKPRLEFMAELFKIVDECLKEQPEKLCSPLNGKELMELFNLPQNKIIGDVKQYLTELVINGELDKNDKDSATKFAEKYLISNTN